MAFNLRLTFGPQWESIPIIRNFTTDLLSAGILDINDAKKVATACSELIENVVKYSAAGGTVIDVTKDLEKGEIRLTIKTAKNSNPFRMLIRSGPPVVIRYIRIQIK